MGRASCRANGMRGCIFSLIFLFISCFALQSQLINYPLSLYNYGFSPNHSDKKGDYRVQKIKGKLTGKGVFTSKEGIVYIGDFKENNFHGKGILISTEAKNLTNFPDSTVIFVGRFNGGKKNGKGICYDIYGNVIFSGKFVDDEPVIPAELEVFPNKYFTDFQTEDFYFIGEFEAEYPDGLGAMLFSNGDLMISDFKEGERKGISVFINNDGNWICENVNGNDVKIVSSSIDYEETLLKAKENLDATTVAGQNYQTNLASLYQRKAGSRFLEVMSRLSEIFMSTGKVLMAVGDIVGSVQTMNSGQRQIYMDDAASGSSKGSNSKKLSGGKTSSLSEQQSYNSDKSTYSKYDTMLSQVFAGNRDASTSEIRQWQSKMRSLRQKWESKGKSFPHSSYESK